jgi:hypothetical protein
MPYVGGVAAYKKKCDEIAGKGYEGFRLGVCGEEERFAGKLMYRRRSDRRTSAREQLLPS